MSRPFLVIPLTLLPLYVLLAAFVPPFDDELYYWCWSRELQLSYYDHPPMVAYLIRASIELFGNEILALRLPAVGAATVVAGVITWLTRPRDILPGVLCSPVLTFAAILVTPDTPLLLFWALYLAWLVKAHERNAQHPAPSTAHDGEAADRGLWPGWLLGGVLLGCGLLGKYTMGLAAIAGAGSFLFVGHRRWVAGYALHALIAGVVATPVLLHNLEHDFVPFRYQWDHTMGDPSPGVARLAEFVGVQALLVGTVPFVVWCWAIRHGKELLADPRLRVCLCLFVPPFAFFLLKAVLGRVEANWPFPCYLACWPLAAEWFRRVRGSTLWRWATRAGFALPLGVSAFLTVHLIEPVAWVPVARDRPTRQWGKIETAERLAANLSKEGYAGPVWVPTYQWVAVLRWHGIDSRQIPGLSRPSHFTEHGSQPDFSSRVLVFTESPTRPESFPLLGIPKSVTEYGIEVRGVPDKPCWLLDYSAPTVTGRLDPPPRHPSR